MQLFQGHDDQAASLRLACGGGEVFWKEPHIRRQDCLILGVVVLQGLASTKMFNLDTRAHMDRHAQA